MATELNRKLPPDQRIPLIELRNEREKIKRLYEETFPNGRLSGMWLLCMVLGGALLAAAVVAEIARTSK